MKIVIMYSMELIKNERKELPPLISWIKTLERRNIDSIECICAEYLLKREENDFYADIVYVPCSLRSFNWKIMRKAIDRNVNKKNIEELYLA